jgi:hypothetical protein
MNDAAQHAQCAYHRAFQIDSLVSHAAIPVPTAVLRILNSLNEICPNCLQSFLLDEEMEGSGEQEGGGIRHRYSRKELLDLAKQIEPLSDECAEMMLAAIGYKHIDVVVDVHPDNLLPPSKKKGGGGKNTSNAKKKKKKNNGDSDSITMSRSSEAINAPGMSTVQEYSTTQPSRVPHMDAVVQQDEGDHQVTATPSSSIIESNSSSDRNSDASAYQMPSFSSDQALAWANSLDMNVKSVLGDQCVLLVDHNSTANDSNAMIINENDSNKNDDVL